MSNIRSMSQEELKAGVERLIANHAGPVDETQTRDILSSCIGELGGLFAHSTTETTVRPHYYFRARRASTFNDDAEYYVPDQFSYLRGSACTDMGRCHVPGHPVFYASNNMETAVLETIKAKEDVILVSHWVSEPRSITLLKILCPSNAESYVAAERDKILKEVNNEYAHYDDFNLSRIRAHCTAWSDLFLGSRSEYALSASIAHSVLYDGYPQGDIDGIVYGSVADPRYANYALHPRFADSLKLYRVYAVRHAGPNYFNFSKCADVDEATGKLEWRDMIATDYPANDPNIPGKPEFQPGETD